MLYWALIFLVIAIVAGIFGFGGIAATASSIAQVLFFIFLVLFIISLFFGWRGGAFGPRRRSDVSHGGEASQQAAPPARGKALQQRPIAAAGPSPGCREATEEHR